MMTQKTDPQPVHRVLAAALGQLGVTRLFGLMGDANLFMVKAYEEGRHGKYIACLHEANAVLAAIGYAQVTGTTGVATVTHGPALTNMSTALVEGVRGGVPLVVLCGDTPPGDTQHSQKIAQREIILALGALFVEMRSPESAVEDLELAFRLAAYHRQPVVFNMRVDLQWALVPHGNDFKVAPPPRLPIASADPELLEEAVGMLASSRRPLILAGRGAISADAREALIKLANRIEAPLATTLKAQGLFDGEAFNIGVCGVLSHPTATDAIMKSDCILAFGASLSRHTTDNAAYTKDKRVIQILPDMLENQRMNLPSIRLIGDAAMTANAMIDLLDMAEIPGSGAADADLRRDLDAEAAAFSVLPKMSATAPGTVDMVPALRQLNAAIPDDRVLAVDLGRFARGAMRSFPVNAPRNMVFTSHFGAIGCGFGQAIGAAVAAADRRTVLVAGDGGFLLSGLSELATVAQQELNMAIIVCNDRCYGAEHVQLTNRGMDGSASAIASTSFAKVAEAMGWSAYSVSDQDSLDAACQLLRDTAGPVLIELSLDPDKVTR